MAQSYTEEHPSVWTIILDLARAGAGFGLALVLWPMSSPEYWMFGFVALACAIAGLKRLLMALIAMGKLTFGRRKVARYRKRGAAAKADNLAGEDALRAKGLIK